MRAERLRYDEPRIGGGLSYEPDPSCCVGGPPRSYHAGSSSMLRARAERARAARDSRSGRHACGHGNKQSRLERHGDMCCVHVLAVTEHLDGARAGCSPHGKVPRNLALDGLMRVSQSPPVLA